MKYFIPTNKTTKDKEWQRILRSVESYEAQNVDITIRFIYEHYGSYNPATSYQELFELYKKIGIATDNDNINTFFSKERDAEAYKGELQLLWRTLLLLSTKDRSWSIKATYDKWKKDFALPQKERKYVNKILKLCQDSSEENKADKENDDKGIVQEKSTLPLVDKDSPYYEYVSGTVYEEMYNLYDSIRNKADHSLKGVALLEEDMEQLLYKMQLQYIRRNNQGSYIPMTKDECEEILKLHNECLNSLTRLYTDNTVYYDCKNLTTLLTQNRNQLKALAQEKLPPLAKVMRSALKPTIELTERSQNIIGDAMSSREAVEYTDEQGVIHRGFFTEEVHETTLKDDIEATIVQLKDKYPEYEKDLHIILPDNDRDTVIETCKTLIQYYNYTSTGNNDKADELLYNFINETKWASDNVKNSQKFKTMLIESIDKIKPLTKKINQHIVLEDSGIKTGDELSGRASAMSDIALALGFPDLIVESRRVTIKIGDKKVNGVMMEGAAPDMKDPAYLTENDPFFSKKIIDQLDSKDVICSFADLQILDFLCGNTDRHATNFFWKQDLSDPENPKLLGVQGIDNDTSFGAITDGGHLKLAYHGNLKIITQKMADAVSSLSKYNLYQLLKQYPLNDEQINAAEKRLELLQSMIENGRKNRGLYYNKNKPQRIVPPNDDTIHILEDRDWKYLKITNLVTNNLFSRKLPDGTKITNANIFWLPHTYKQAFVDKDFRHRFFKIGKVKEPITYSKQQPKEPDIQKEPKAPIPEYNTLIELHQAEASRLKEIRKTLYDNGGKDFNGRSDEFKKMYHSLVKYINQYLKLNKILKTVTENLGEEIMGAELKKELALANCYKKMSDNKKQLDTLISDYVNRDRRYITSDNQHRIDAAKALQTYLKTDKESEKIYADYTAKKIKHHEEHVNKYSSYTPGQDLKLANNALNQVFGTMKFTLIDNLNTLPAGSELHAKGVKVANALARLWNYSMNSVNQSFYSVKTPEKKKGMLDEQFKKENASLEQLQKDISKKSVDEPDDISMRQIKMDLKDVIAYETLLNSYDSRENAKSIKALIEIQDGKPPVAITPAQVRNVLHNLYTTETAISKNRAENIQQQKKEEMFEQLNRPVPKKKGRKV